MKPLVVLIGLGVLVGGGIAIASAMSKKEVTLRYGAAYRWRDSRGFSNAELVDQYQSLGFQSVTVNGVRSGTDVTEGSYVQGFWGGEDGTVWDVPDGLSTPEMVIAPPTAARNVNPNLASPGISNVIPGLTYVPNPNARS